MGAIRSHSTGTTDAAWDAGDNVKNLKSDQGEGYYRKAFAWQDPDADPTTKSAYKFPHHMVSGDGDIGAANTRAASSGIGVLNGGRGGASIPDADRQGVYNHLARHIDDGGKDVPDLASRSEVLEQYFRAEPLERKTFAMFEVKAEGNGQFSGYASAYAKDLQGDKIIPGAFGQTIAEKKGKVPILYNHDSDRLPLGLSTSLSEDGKGLMLNGQLFTGTTDGNNAYEMLKAAADIGYRMGMSIGFIANDWDWDEENNLRSIKEIDLWEVSLTPFPAQPKAYVADVKSIREFERYLRDAEHLSKADARRIVRVASDLNLSSGGMLGDSNRYSRVLRAFAAAPWGTE
jgi:HK97 family phage prohead protease